MARYVISNFNAGNFEKITVAGTSIGITSTLYTKDAGGGKVTHASSVFLSIETESVRIRWDGGAPTSTDGHLLVAGDSIEIEGRGNVRNLRMIRITNSATAHVTVHYDPTIQ